MTIEAKYRALSGRLDEATLRLWVATEARRLGRGGISLVAKVAGLSRTTIYAGLSELKIGVTEGIDHRADAREQTAATRCGRWRERLTDKEAHLLEDLDALVEPTTRGDPMSPLRWTCKSPARLVEELQRQGHSVSQRTVCERRHHAGFSLQSTRKTREGEHHEGGDAQFASIAQMVGQYQAAGDSVISVDTKKKELTGNCQHAGREWSPKGEPEPVRVHDFIVAPYGV